VHRWETQKLASILSASLSSLVFCDVSGSGGGCYRGFAGIGVLHIEQGREPMAKGKLRILYGEGDGEVLALQVVSFEKAGHTVQPAEGRKKVEEALRNGQFDLVVLGPTLSRNDRHHLPYMVKKVSAETSVLVMHADGSRHPYVDACTDTGANLETVLARIESMKIAGMMAAAAGAGR
jgi:hypothetical protein